MAALSEGLLGAGVRLRSYEQGNHKTTCPQCSQQRRKSKDPCLSVTVESERSAVWQCHHCGWSGSVGGGYARREERTYKRPRPLSGERNDKLLAWFKGRGISAQTVQRAGIEAVSTWMPGCEKGQEERAIAFPFYRDGELINVKYRTADKRFRQSGGAEPIFFGLDQVGDAEEIVIVEGEMDALACWEAGVAAISVPDGSPQEALPADSAKMNFLANSLPSIDMVDGVERRFVLALDADGPGRVMEEELARRLGKHRCRKARFPEACKDINDVLLNYGAQEVKDCITHAENFPIDGVQTCDDHFDAFLQLYRKGRERGLSTGWPMLDEKVTVKPGNLWVITGIPNHGKSEWLDALAVNLAEKHGFFFGVASFENEPEDHIGKLVEKRLRKRFYQSNSVPPEHDAGRMSEQEAIAGHQWCNEHFAMIRKDGDDPPTIEWVLERAKALVVQRGMNALIVDPYNELSKERGDQSETDFISDMLGRMTRFAKRHGVVVFIVAHPRIVRKEDGVEPPPSLYDIAGSANWNNKADVGVVVYRNPEEYGVTRVYIRKVRHKAVGRGGTRQMFKWLPNCGAFDDIDDDSLEARMATSGKNRHA